MMKKVQLLILFMLPLFFANTACNGSKNGYVVKGAMKGAANLQAVLEQAHFDRTNVSLGTASCDADGNFEFELKEPIQQGLYTLTIGAKKMFFMLDGKESEVDIQGDINTMDRLQVTFTGSETAKCYATMVQGLYSSQFNTGDQLKSYIKDKSCNPLMAAFFTMQLLGRDAAGFVPEFKEASKNLGEYMPSSKYAIDFNALVAGLETQVTQSQGSGGIQVGGEAPNISLTDPSGKMRSLSELRGKIVLLDFWASWCAPCRRANPHVVEIYNKYKGKGFDVFSVSLDNPNGKEKWIQAIQQDGLIWPNHVSDLLGWNSAAAALYGVRSIPQTFLINREGKIVAVNPRDNLEAELLKVL